MSNPCRKQGPVLKSFGAFLCGPKPAQRMLPSITQHLWWDQYHQGSKGSSCWGQGGGVCRCSQLYYRYCRQLQLHRCSPVLQLSGLFSVNCIKTYCPILHPETARAAARLIAVSLSRLAGERRRGAARGDRHFL